MDDLGAIAERLADARRVLFITGAGLSADSGLPTYRGIGGLYEDAVTEDDLPIEVALSGEMLNRRPAGVWKHIAQIEEGAMGAGFNGAHAAITRMQRRFDHCTVLTQNIDGFHLDAGSSDVIEMHGNVHQLDCTVCDWHDCVDDYAGLAVPPSCPACGALVRPRVVLFGEMLPLEALARLERAVERGFDAVFSVGTTSVFPYIAAPVVEARRRGKLTVEINPGDTEVSHLVDYRLRERAINVLPKLADLLEENR